MYHIFIGFNSNYNQDVKLFFFFFFYELNTMCITVHTMSKGPGLLNELGSWINEQRLCKLQTRGSGEPVSLT